MEIAAKPSKPRYGYTDVELNGRTVKADAKPLASAGQMKRGGVGVNDTNAIIKNDLFDGPFGRTNTKLTGPELNAARHMVQNPEQYGLTGRGEDNLRSKLGFSVTPLTDMEPVKNYGRVDASWDKNRPLDAKAVEMAKALISRPGVRALNENDVERLRRVIVADGTFAGPMVGSYERNTVDYISEKFAFTKTGQAAWQAQVMSKVGQTAAAS